MQASRRHATSSNGLTYGHKKAILFLCPILDVCETALEKETSFLVEKHRRIIGYVASKHCSVVWTLPLNVNAFKATRARPHVPQHCHGVLLLRARYRRDTNSVSICSLHVTSFVSGVGYCYLLLGSKYPFCGAWPLVADEPLALQMKCCQTCDSAR